MFKTLRKKSGKLWRKNFYIILPVFIYILLRVPSLLEGFWYGDEGIYAAVAQGLHYDKTLYSETFDHKPPLIYWIYYIYGFWGWEIGLTLLRMTTIVLGVASLILLFKIQKKLKFNKVVIFLSLLFFAIFYGTPVFEGNTANAESFFVPVNLLLLYLLIKNNRGYVIGLLAFVTFIIKTPGVIESAIIIFVFLIVDFKAKGMQDVYKSVVKITIGFIFPIFFLSLIFLFRGNFLDFIQAAFLTSFSYSEELNESLVLFGFAGFAPLKFRALFFLGTLAITSVSFLYKTLGKYTFILISLFTVQFFCILLSGREYPHYFLQILPGITLLGGYMLSKVEGKNFYQSFDNFKYILLTLLLFHFTVLTFTRGTSIDYYIPVKNYYMDFITYKETRDTAWWRNGWSVKRVEKFGEYFNREYKEYDSYYIHTKDPWVIALIERNYTNKLVVNYHITYQKNFLQEELKNIDKADVLVYDLNLNTNNDIYEKISGYELRDEQYDFAVYIK